MTDELHRVTITRVGCDETTIRVEEDETVLAAAGRHGLDLPSTCEWGACARCIARLMAGEVEYTDRPRVLEKYGYGSYPRVSADGECTKYVLLCIAQPRIDCRVEIEPDLAEELSAG